MKFSQEKICQKKGIQIFFYLPKRNYKQKYNNTMK
jgi:hypothetical protein